MIESKMVNGQRRFFLGMMAPQLDHENNWHSLEEIEASITETRAVAAETRRDGFAALADDIYNRKPAVRTANATAAVSNVAPAVGRQMAEEAAAFGRARAEQRRMDSERATPGRRTSTPVPTGAAWVAMTTTSATWLRTSTRRPSTQLQSPHHGFLGE